MKCEIGSGKHSKFLIAAALYKKKYSERLNGKFQTLSLCAVIHRRSGQIAAKHQCESNCISFLNEGSISRLVEQITEKYDKYSCNKISA